MALVLVGSMVMVTSAGVLTGIALAWLEFALSPAEFNAETT